MLHSSAALTRAKATTATPGEINAPLPLYSPTARYENQVIAEESQNADNKRGPPQCPRRPGRRRRLLRSQRADATEASGEATGLPGVDRRRNVLGVPDGRRHGRPGHDGRHARRADGRRQECQGGVRLHADRHGGPLDGRHALYQPQHEPRRGAAGGAEPPRRSHRRSSCRLRRSRSRCRRKRARTSPRIGTTNRPRAS